MEPEIKNAGAPCEPQATPMVTGFGTASLDGGPPYSATRFVLSFKLPGPAAPNNHSSAHTPAGVGKPAYREAGPKDWIMANKEARHNYLTAETREVLFEHATWMVMACEAQPITMTAPDGLELKLKGEVRPPAIVLFEDTCGVELLRRGFLIVEVAFRGNDSADLRLDDLLLFNELFRYWREPFKGDGQAIPSHSDLFQKQLQDFAEPFRKMTGRPEQDLAPNTPGVRKDLYGERWLSLLQVPFADGRAPLAGANCTADDFFGDYADERAFVWTRALFSKREELELIVPGGRDADKKWKAEASPESGFRKMFGYWVKLLNADQPALKWDKGVPSSYDSCIETNKTTAFERDWAAQRTYRRWEDYNCYYGFNSFSAAMMSEACKNPPTWQHWFQMYFDQMLLLFYVRVTLFQFSRQLTEISGSMLGRRGEQPSDKYLEQWQGGFRRLRSAFTCFENLYQFPLLSNQQQAVEMYVYLRKGMDISDLYDEISREIQGSDALLESEVEERRNQLSNTLNRLAVLGFGVSAAFGMFQIEAMTNLISKCPWSLGLSILLFGVFAGLWCWLFLLMLKWFKKKAL